MDLEGIILTNRSEKDKYHVISLIHEKKKTEEIKAYSYKEQIGG